MSHLTGPFVLLWRIPGVSSLRASRFLALSASAAKGPERSDSHPREFQKREEGKQAQRKGGRTTSTPSNSTALHLVLLCFVCFVLYCTANFVVFCSLRLDALAPGTLWHRSIAPRWYRTKERKGKERKGALHCVPTSATHGLQRGRGRQGQGQGQGQGKGKDNVSVAAATSSSSSLGARVTRSLARCPPRPRRPRRRPHPRRRPPARAALRRAALLDDSSACAAERGARRGGQATRRTAPHFVRRAAARGAIISASSASSARAEADRRTRPCQPHGALRLASPRHSAAQRSAVHSSGAGQVHRATEVHFLVVSRVVVAAQTAGRTGSRAFGPEPAPEPAPVPVPAPVPAPAPSQHRARGTRGEATLLVSDLAPRHRRRVKSGRQRCIALLRLSCSLRSSSGTVAGTQPDTKPCRLGRCGLRSV